MARINSKICFVVLGLLQLHTVTGQTAATTAASVPAAVTGTAPAVPAAAAAPLDPAASPNIRTDVTDTVMALLNETGYSGSANDANVQEIVAMLMNGTVPTDADLIRLGFIPQPAPAQMTTPPPYIIPNQPPLDTSITFPTGNLPTGSQTGQSSGVNSGPSPGSFPNPGFSMGGFQAPLGAPTGSQGPPQSGTGVGGNDPFGGALSMGNGAGMQNFMSMLGPPGTSPKPALGDPFSMNTINGGAAAQLPNLGPIDPNALGPKPIPNMGPVGGLGTPGSTTDLLANLGTPGMGGLPPGMGGLPPGMGGLPPGMGGLPPSPPTGILDAPPPRRSGGNMMSNPMMMMMMMNPELMDQMMSGENPMLTYMFMQQMNKRPQTPRPSTGLGSLGGFPGGAGALPMPLPGQSPLGGAPGGIMDMMNTMSAAGPGGLGAPGVPMDLTALTGLGGGMGSVPGTPVNPMDLIQGSLSSSAGPGVPPTDLLPFPGLGAGIPGMAGPIPGGAPITDPFAATVG
ncbi:hypothetical protein BsWGS_17301 [Bradybaena similaris]